MFGFSLILTGLISVFTFLVVGAITFFAVSRVAASAPGVDAETARSRS
jgi:hypothetical protein